MKTKNLLLLIAAFATISVQSAVITVSNNANNPGQYSNLQTAVTAAASNDIIYLIGSGVTYGDVTISKPLTIIGAGALPNKSLPLNTIIGTITFGYNTTTATSGSGSSIYGCDIATMYFANAAPLTGSNPGLSNIVISRNKIQTMYWSTHPTIISNSNCTISNNLIQNFYGSYDYGGGSKLNNCIVKNNIIYSASGVGNQAAGSWILSNNVISGSFSSISSAIISNNIFTFGSGGNFSSNTTCAFANNIFYSSGTAFAADFLNTGSLTGSGNLINQNPNFVNSTTNINILNSYSYTYPAAGPFIDLNLTAASVGKNYGTDGTDVGIYGGATPFIEGATGDTRFRYFSKPAIPQMLTMVINNPQVSQNGTLSVSFSAAKQD